MFKRKSKITPKSDFLKYLESQVIQAQGMNREYAIFPIENAEKVEWAKEFVKQRNFSLWVSHQTDGLVYYNMRGWVV